MEEAEQLLTQIAAFNPSYVYFRRPPFYTAKTPVFREVTLEHGSPSWQEFN